MKIFQVEGISSGRWYVSVYDSRVVRGSVVCRNSSSAPAVAIVFACIKQGPSYQFVVWDAVHFLRTGVIHHAPLAGSSGLQGVIHHARTKEIASRNTMKPTMYRV